MLEVKRKPASPSHGATAPARAYSDQPGAGHAESVGPSGQLRPVAPATEKELRAFQTKLPVIIGEVHFKGTLSADGIIMGHIGFGNGLSLKQRTISITTRTVGDFNFRDMVQARWLYRRRSIQKRNTIVDTEAD